MLADFLAENGQAIDTGLLLYFPAPHSFTGEDVLELQGHGGPVVMQMLLGRCLDLGARLAEPGEFSRRAFLNGKMDLAQAEAIADLIDASSASAARSAVRSLQGEFSRAVGRLSEQLIDLRMLVEATLDFPEEEIDFLKAADATGRLQSIHDQLALTLKRATQGCLLQTGMHIVLVGQPNVGKSSLLNVLAGDDLAIVTPIAGTTRDALRTRIELEGIPLHLIDTAGLRETDDEVERLGIARSWKEIEKADLILLLVDACTGITPDELAILDRLPKQVRRVTVYNKIDLLNRHAERHEESADTTHAAVAGSGVSLSAKTGEGIDLLRQELLSIAGWQETEEVFIARERHVRALKATRVHLEMAMAQCLSAQPALELFAEELRLAQQALGEITGEFSSDDLLGVIFSRFCIGK